MKTRIKIIILLACIVLPMTAVADSREDILKVLGQVKPEMPKSEVDKLFQKYMKGTNWPASEGKTAQLIGTRRGTYDVDTSKKDQLTLKDCDVYRHSDEGQFDSDWGIICFKNGKADWVDFAPD